MDLRHIPRIAIPRLPIPHPAILYLAIARIVIPHPAILYLAVWCFARHTKFSSRPVQTGSDRFKNSSGQFRPVQDRFRPVQTRSDKSRPADRLNSVQEKRKIRFSGMGGKDEVIKMGETPLSAGAPSGKRRKKSDRRRRPYCAVQTCCGRGHGSFEK